MINLSPDICYKLRDARRAAKLSQSRLASEVGCKQSALSMFEQGEPTKLNDEVVEKLAAKFGIDLKATAGKAEEAKIELTAPATGFCPNPSCPTNHEYLVDGRRIFLPKREDADPIGGCYCAFCGEVLEKRCPNCGAPVHPGAICSLCGNPYVVI